MWSSVGILTWGGKKHIKRLGREGVGPCLVMIAFLPSFAHQQQSKPTSPTTNQDVNMWEQGFPSLE